MINLILFEKLKEQHHFSNAKPDEALDLVKVQKIFCQFLILNLTHLAIHIKTSIELCPKYVR